MIWKGIKKVLVEGSDFVIRVVDFGTPRIDGCVTAAPSGINCIYINQRVCKDRQRKALIHELEHIEHDDLYNDVDSAAEIERRRS